MGVSDRGSDRYQLARFTPWDVDVNGFGMRLGQNLMLKPETAGAAAAA